MGVRGLWSILDNVKEDVNIESLKGKTLAVDLSIWIVESIEALKHTNILRPHLRNLFFRINYMMKHGVKLVFAVEGTSPVLKNRTIENRLRRSKRNKLRDPQISKHRTIHRSRFNAVIKECCGLLDSLGVPYVQSYGEAEAMCAYLEISKKVDGCITNDGDVLLYGALNVYRNFSMKEDQHHVVKVTLYRMQNIKDILNLDQIKLISLALILGCDYTSGVKGIGKSAIMTFMNSFNISASGATESILDRFISWRDFDYKFKDILDFQLRKKCIMVKGFPDVEVVKEFQVSKDSLTTKLIWRQPCFFRFNDFTFRNMCWPDAYSEDKITRYLSRYELLNREVPASLRLDAIIKKMIVRGVPSLELHWKLKGHTSNRPLVSVEPEELLKCRYDHEIKKFHESVADMKDEIKIKKNKTKKKRNTSNKENSKVEVAENEIIISGSLSNKAPLSSHDSSLLDDLSLDNDSRVSEYSSHTDDSLLSDDASATDDSSLTDNSYSFDPELYGDIITDLIDNVDLLKLDDSLASHVQHSENTIIDQPGGEPHDLPEKKLSRHHSVEKVQEGTTSSANVTSANVTSATTDSPIHSSPCAHIPTRPSLTASSPTVNVESSATGLLETTFDVDDLSENSATGSESDFFIPLCQRMTAI